MTIAALEREHVQAAARLLHEGFREHWPHAWPTVEEAVAEVEANLDDPERVAVAALDDGELIGWVGAVENYHGHAWELHPMVVAGTQRRRGVGRALIEGLERELVSRGATTIYLGTDDEDHMTSIAGVDLYPDPLAALQRIRNVNGHPFEFYERVGFVVTGVIPDANGLGKPDIFMAQAHRLGWLTGSPLSNTLR